MDVEWKWQRFGRFSGLVVAQVASMSDRGGVDPGWIVLVTGRSHELGGRYATEFDAIAGR